MELSIYSTGDGRRPFEEWLDGLRDSRVRIRILARLSRLEAGNLGDCRPLRDGIQELKIDDGPGFRIYISRQGPMLVLLLCGSDKADQAQMIETAIAYLNDWKRRSNR